LVITTFLIKKFMSTNFVIFCYSFNNQNHKFCNSEV
jgi:hypothetical protein